MTEHPTSVRQCATSALILPEPPVTSIFFDPLHKRLCTLSDFFNGVAWLEKCRPQSKKICTSISISLHSVWENAPNHCYECISRQYCEDYCDYKIIKNRSTSMLSEEGLALPVPCFKHPLAALYTQHTQPH